MTVLDAVRDSGQVPAERMGEVAGRISFFVNAGVRFVEEMCKMRPGTGAGEGAAAPRTMAPIMASVQSGNPPHVSPE